MAFYVDFHGKASFTLKTGIMQALQQRFHVLKLSQTIFLKKVR
jgi:hypothetical protein